jgi:hypothetical protein
LENNGLLEIFCEGSRLFWGEWKKPLTKAYKRAIFKAKVYFAEYRFTED